MSACVSCLQKKAPLSCVLCEASLCKDCVQFVDENSFPFCHLMQQKMHVGAQCPNCYQEKSLSHVEKYEEILQKAKNIDIYYRRINGKEARLMERMEPALKVENCSDEEDVLMSLAFLAVQMGATAVIDVEVFSQKTKDGSYTTVTWNGVGAASTRKPPHPTR